MKTHGKHALLGIFIMASRWEDLFLSLSLSSISCPPWRMPSAYYSTTQTGRVKEGKKD
jgi:hypothetical protein